MVNPEGEQIVKNLSNARNRLALTPEGEVIPSTRNVEEYLTYIVDTAVDELDESLRELRPLVLNMMKKVRERDEINRMYPDELRNFIITTVITVGLLGSNAVTLPILRDVKNPQINTLMSVFNTLTDSNTFQLMTTDERVENGLKSAFVMLWLLFSIVAAVAGCIHAGFLLFGDSGLVEQFKNHSGKRGHLRDEILNLANQIGVGTKSKKSRVPLRIKRSLVIRELEKFVRKYDVAKAQLVVLDEQEADEAKEIARLREQSISEFGQQDSHQTNRHHSNRK